MRVRTILTATALAGAATFPMAGVALAQDRDCPDFRSQQDAQSALDLSPYDDERLDADGDRIACEDHFDNGDGDGSDPDDRDNPDDRSAGSSDHDTGDDTSDSDDGEAPAGSVETGAGGTAGGPGAAAPLALAGASTLVIGGVLVAARRSGRQRG